MITVHRLRGKFRERAPELVTSIGMLWWGMITMVVPDLFDQPFFYPLSLFMAQPFWGIMASTIGLLSFISLAINGLWRPTAHLRAICSIFKVAVWSTLLLASLTTEGRILGVPTFAMLVSLDLLALWWAAGDARLADDIAAKYRKSRNGI